MKLHADPPTDRNTVTAYGSGYVEVNRIRYQHAIVLIPNEPVRPWPASDFESLRVEDFDAIRAYTPDVVLLGTGRQQRFLHPRLLTPLTQARIGVEMMDTPAACRTYNILMAEGRRVLAILLIEP
ncbi:MAG: Mth938-like domain-containing protein [Sutterellaceae bacterium]|nr:Mth938-like domain-containing protein [Burkholderiaceae bacterium]MCX7900798.1 Mth938-like domain-containing protein [Burkholderiaceae bacterium]MDW8429086.1 Mth938-like domain-containing protein [Sutterellaceae bacterium]